MASGTSKSRRHLGPQNWLSAVFRLCVCVSSLSLFLFVFVCARLRACERASVRERERERERERAREERERAREGEKSMRWGELEHYWRVLKKNKQDHHKESWICGREINGLIRRGREDRGRGGEQYYNRVPSVREGATRSLSSSSSARSSSSRRE